MKTTKATIEPLWSCDYWDGPVSGVCRYQGDLVWFWMLEDWHERPDEDRLFGIYPMTEAERTVEVERNDAFEKYVGKHSRLDGKYKTFEGRDERTDWMEFYRIYPPDEQSYPSTEGEPLLRLTGDELFGYTE